MRDSAEILGFFESRLDPALLLLQRLVEMESGSADKRGIDRLADFLAGEFLGRGADAEVITVQERGNIVRAQWHASAGSRPVMVLGHMDTVWPAGEVGRRPFRISRGCAYGPGIFDMKGGLLLCLLACDAFAQGRVSPGRDVVFFFTSDEEIGTEAGLPFLRAQAAECDAVLCLEPPLPGGKAKTFRKGISEIKLRVRGIPAHAGLDHEKGANAIIELARQLLRLQGLTDYARGITISAGTVRGGSAVNVVPAEAEAMIDFRVATAADGTWLEAQLRSWKPFDSRCTLEWTRGSHRPPLERTPAVASLFETAREVAGSLGMDLGEGPSGGGSDGSFTAAMGVPTLDGLGVEGDGAHAVDEHVIVADIPRRAALLACLVQSLGAAQQGCPGDRQPRTGLVDQ